jgi:hypothetical protein
MEEVKLPDLPQPVDWCTDQADHRHDTFTAPQMQEYARQAVLADRDARQSEAEQVCAEAYQVVGSLLDDLGIFDTDEGEKILDNLSQAQMIHNDVLPWESAAAIREGK